MLLVDERRCAFGLDPALLPHAGGGAVLAPASFLERFVDVRVIGDGERRAIVRRIAATRTELGLATHVRRSPSFAARVLAAIDAGETLFADLVGEVRTLLAFANAVDVRDALGRALAMPAAPEERVAIDAALLAGDAAFAWRRLASVAGCGLDPVERGAIAPPPLDLVAVASVIAFLRYAASESDADARAALRSKLAPIDPDDARTLLASAGDAADVLDVIDAGAAGNGREFAHALRSIARAYRVPDAGLGDVLAALARALDPPAATLAALMRIARDFDAARALGPSWEAADAIDEIGAELADCRALPAATLAFAPAPAPIVEPEPPVPVTARRATFSASSLNAFAECERKWYFRYVCSAVEDRGSSASFYGIAFHAALEDFHETHTRFETGDATALASVLDFCIVASFDRHRTRFDAPVEFELQKRRARRTGKRYVAWLIERARREPFTVVGCEAAADVPLGGYHFIGYIDRLDRDDASGGVTVVDYKTGAIAKSAGDYLADVLAFRDFQLPFYYWARTAAGDRVSRLALVPLKDALLDVAPIELTVVAQRPRSTGRSNATTAQIGVPDLERARDRMIELAERLASPTLAHYAAATDPDACRYCAYRDACRERPAVAEERFGR
jgi:RecB family exonuclease